MCMLQFHYDNTGGDVNETVEVIFPTTVAGNVSIVLYNGGDTTAAAAAAVQYGTSLQLPNGTQIGSTGFSVAFVRTPGIQNGAPDGIALVCGRSVVQFLSYEGVLTANNGPAAGLTSTDIGVSETGEGSACSGPLLSTFQHLFTGIWEDQHNT